MSFSATITDPHDADAMPMWESRDHADLDDALHAAQAHICASRPGDRIVGEGHGVYAVYAGHAPSTRVATLLITPTDDQLDVAVQLRQLAGRYERSGATEYAQALRRQAAQCLADTTTEPYLQTVRNAEKTR